MSKLIINNLTDFPMEQVLGWAAEVIKIGRISRDKTQYCYAVSIPYLSYSINIFSDLNKSSDKLTITSRKMK